MHVSHTSISCNKQLYRLFYSGSMVCIYHLLLVALVLMGTGVQSFLPLPMNRRLDHSARILHSNGHLSKVFRSPGTRRNLRADTKLYGIPKLFRWLIDLYPLVLESVGEGLSNNAMMVDNFYLDMNGIIHTCTHSNNDKLIPLNEQDMFLRIFAYTDRLYKLVNPKRQMFLAVDGVAPRAKMNQQRSRRFRSSKEREALIAEHIAKEGQLPDEESFDSNCITPGTEFMHRLSIAFRSWIEHKMKTDPFWQNGAEVIFSGPDVPGEGEHKVMDLIREEREADPTYTPGKYRHCLYGLDADLIMLSLVTHEPYFVLLREKIATRKEPKQTKDVLAYTQEDFECLEITILRRMLKLHFHRMEEDLQRTRKSALTHAEGAPIVGGSKVDSNSGAAQSKHGSSITARAEGAKKVWMASAAAAAAEEAGQAEALKNAVSKVVPWTAAFDLERIIDDFVFMCFFIGNDFLPCLPHLDIADGSLNMMMNTYRDTLPRVGGYLTNKTSIHLPRVELFLQEVARREPLYFEQRAVDDKEVEFAGPGYRSHYYKSKFGIEEGDEAAISRIVQSYLEGLYWVLTYYHRGCGSWTWFYPYLYAPLASDLVKLGDYSVSFQQGRPFTPLLQLLSVLPPQSGAFLPPSYEAVMSDPGSPLVEYYPSDFVVDANGKKNAWECVVCIPFIQEDMLVDEVSKIDHSAELTAEERLRNVPGRMHRYLPKNGVKSSVGTGSSTSDSNGVEQAVVVDGKSGTGTAKWGNALVDDRKKHLGGYKPYLGSFKPKRKY